MTFSIRLHIKDLELLKLIQSFFEGLGTIVFQADKEAIFRVSSVKELEGIINHFDKYPLITQKWADFILFKQAFEIVKCQKHLTLEGLNELVSIKAAMNKEVSLYSVFPSLIKN